MTAKSVRKRRVRDPAEPSRTRRQDADASPECGGSYRLSIDRNWRITSISPAAARWGGSTPQDLLGVDSRKRWPLPARLVEAIEGSFSSGKPSMVEFASVLIPGRWVEFQVLPSRRGADIRFEDITRPVTGQRWRTGDSPDTLGVEGGTAEIALLDDRGGIVSVNAAWRATLTQYYPQIPDAGVGARYVDVSKEVLPDLDEAALCAELDALLAGRSSCFSATFALPSKQRRQVQVTALTIGPRQHLLAIYDDLTGWEQIARALGERSDQLLHTQEEERQRIAIELHDSVSQHLAALTLSLASLRRRVGEDEAAVSIIDDMGKLTKQSVQEIRVLSYLMYASAQEREGLEASVRRLAEGFGRRADLDVTFDVRGPFDALDPATQHAMFRVVQEALSNVHRHAQAKAVSVSLERRAGDLIARIVDDGRGFDAERRKAPLGVGIVGMRARIEHLGGTLEIANGAKRGTVVTASVPVAPATGVGAG